MTHPKSWQCCQPEKPHSFDVARQGYVNLLPVQHKKSKQPGDSTLAILARQRFLSQGFYQPLQQKIVTSLSTTPITHLLDVGCGEGYYTQAMQPLAQHLTAIDISKAGVIQTAKLSKKKSTNTLTCLVASANRLPLQTGCVDVITSIFSPIVVNEFTRVLAEGGKLLIAKPATKHLWALRALLFDTVRQHNSDKFIDQLADNFQLTEQHTVEVDMLLDTVNLTDLMTMTPYAYRAKAEKRANALAQAPLELKAKFSVYLFTKKSLAI